MEKPRDVIAQFEAAGMLVANLEERIWRNEKQQQPPLRIRSASGDAVARAELKALEAHVVEWRSDLKRLASEDVVEISGDDG